jgi:hypothetical protein
MREGMTKLRAFPRSRLIEVPLCRMRTSELSLFQALGDPTAATDPIEADPRLFWDIDWDCGMVMGLQFHQLTEELEVQLDAADVAHALRHLGVPAYEMHFLRLDDPARFVELCDPPELGWEVWKQVGEGQGERVHLRLSPRDADCWAGELTSQTGVRHWAARPDPLDDLAAR